MVFKIFIALFFCWWNLIIAKTCSSTQYTCQSWPGIYTTSERDSCISIKFKCDGNTDCPLGDDEWNCPGCNETGFICNQTQTCINAEYKCDGTWDCPNQEDEDKSCGACNSTTQWQCSTNGRCIPLTSLCDGIVDCLNKEDEIISNCNITLSTSPIEKVYVFVDNKNNNSSNTVNTVTIIFIILVSILILLLLCFMYLFLRYYLQSKHLQDQVFQPNMSMINGESNINVQCTQPQTPLLEQDVVQNLIISPKKLNCNHTPIHINHNHTNNINHTNPIHNLTLNLSPRLAKMLSPTPKIIKNVITPRTRSNQPTPKSTGRRTPISLPPILTNIIHGTTPRIDGYQKVKRQDSQLSELNDDDTNSNINTPNNHSNHHHHHHNLDSPKTEMNGNIIINNNNSVINTPNHNNDDTDTDQDNEKQALTNNHILMINNNTSPAPETPL